MLTILPESDGLIAYEVDGRIDKADIERAIAHIDERLKSRRGPVDMLAIIREVGVITPPALARDIQYSLSRIHEISRFRRVAVVSDKSWVRAIAGAEDLMIPRIEVKAFSMDDEDIARLWLKSGRPTATF